MRKLLLAVALVAASFLGGAVVNGPGLGWLGSKLRGVGIGVTPGFAPSPGPTAGTPTQADSSEVGAGSPGEIPSIPPPTLAADAPPRPADPAPDLNPPAPPDSEPMPSVAAPDPPSHPESVPTPPAGPAATAPAAPAPLSMPAPAPTDGALAPAVLAPNPPEADGGATAPRDWAEVRARLRALGVSRYRVEAEADGRTRFSCLIPLAGRAVGHHFEAEGDDEFQAAEATLRRVALWKATEGAAP